MWSPSSPPGARRSIGSSQRGTLPTPPPCPASTRTAAVGAHPSPRYAAAVGARPPRARPPAPAPWR